MHLLDYRKVTMIKYCGVNGDKTSIYRTNFNELTMKETVFQRQAYDGRLWPDGIICIPMLLHCNATMANWGGILFTLTYLENFGTDNSKS
jgi:hypothetical protein